MNGAAPYCTEQLKSHVCGAGVCVASPSGALSDWVFEGDVRLTHCILVVTIPRGGWRGGYGRRTE